MIQAAEADIVSPAVAAQDPHGLLGQVILILQDLRSQSASLALAALDHTSFQSSDVILSGLIVGSAVSHGIQPLLASFLDLSGGILHSNQLLSELSQTAADSVLSQGHAQTKLSVILEQGVLPSGAVASLVHSVRSGRCGTAPDRGAASGVGNEHLVAEQLSSQLGVRSLAAAAAGAGELQQGLLELAALNGGLLELSGNLFLSRQVDAILEDSLLITLRVDGSHLQSLLLGGAGGHAGAAAGAVQRRDDHSKVHAGDTGHGLSLGAGRSSSQLFIGHSDGTDNCMRTHIRALVTLDAVVHDPLGNIHSHAALLVSGSALGRSAVSILLKGGDRQILAVEGVHGEHHVVHVIHQLGTVAGSNLSLGIVHSVLPGSGDFHLHIAVGATIDSVVVHLDDGLALAAVGLGSGVLHVLDSILFGDDLSNGEESGLQHGVGTGAQAQLLADLEGIDGIEVDVVVGDEFLHLAGQTLVQLLGIPRAVQQEAAALLQILHHVVGLQVSRIGAGHEVSLGDVVGGLDGGVTKTQVRNGQTAGLLGVIVEVALSVHIGVVTDDLDGVLVGANSTVGAQTPELTRSGASRSGIGILVGLQGQMGHIVHNADGEALLGLGLLHVAVDSDDIAGLGVLGTQTVTAGVHGASAEGSAVDSSQNVQVQGLADGAGLLGTIQNRDLLHSLRQHVQQALSHKGTIQMDLHQTHLLASGIQVVDDFLNGLASGTHGDDDLVGIGSAIVVEGLVVGADLLVNLIHVVHDNLGNSVVVLVAGFASLEEDVAVLSLTAEHRMLGVQGAAAERIHSIPIQHLSQIVIVPHLDLLDLMRGAETIEEVEERYPALDCGQMGHGAQVHDFLRAVGAQHCIASLTAGIHVGVIAKDVQSMGGQGTSGHMDDAGQQLTGHLVHIGDHQQQALRSGVSGGESTSCQRAVHSTSGASLGLHLGDPDFSAEQVLAACSGILVGLIRHYRRGRDGIDGGNVGKRIRHMRGGAVTIHGFHFSCHEVFPPFRMIERNLTGIFRWTS